MCSRAGAVAIPTCWDGRSLAAVSASVRDRAVEGVVRACYSAGEDLDTLRRQFLHTLRRVVGFDAAFMATADPDTLLFTSAFADDALVESGPLFLDNEFGADHDLNRFVESFTLMI